MVIWRAAEWEVLKTKRVVPCESKLIFIVFIAYNNINNFPDNMSSLNSRGKVLCLSKSQVFTSMIQLEINANLALLYEVPELVLCF